MLRKNEKRHCELTKSQCYCSSSNRHTKSVQVNHSAQIFPPVLLWHPDRGDPKGRDWHPIFAVFRIPKTSEKAPTLTKHCPCAAKSRLVLRKTFKNHSKSDEKSYQFPTVIKCNCMIVTKTIILFWWSQHMLWWGFWNIDQTNLIPLWIEIKVCAKRPQRVLRAV